jgi:hypothetical protein
MRDWDYGKPGQQYPCWTVLAHKASDTAIVYCEQGFGPESPWGLVSLAGTEIGMDCSWFPSFAEAYFDSFAAADLPIWRVFKRIEGATFPGVPLTHESTWESTWNEVENLRSLDSHAHYDCWHSIELAKSKT